MIDIGVGTGRTSLHFAPAVREYLGVDYSAQLIDHCRVRFGDSDLQFLEADARNLVSEVGGSFDAALFSYNGIDYIGHEDRLRVLRQVHDVLTDGGVFFFSSHSLHGLVRWWAWPGWRRGAPAQSAARLLWAIASIPVLAWRNRAVRRRDINNRGWAVVDDGAYRGRVQTYYVDPREQVRQLTEAGFEVLATYAMDGTPLDAETTNYRGWISYQARKIN